MGILINLRPYLVSQANVPRSICLYILIAGTPFFFANSATVKYCFTSFFLPMCKCIKLYTYETIPCLKIYFISFSIESLQIV